MKLSEQNIKLTGKWFASGKQVSIGLLFPNDPSGEAWNVINCDARQCRRKIMSKKNEEIAIKPGIVKGFYGVIKSETIDETAKTVWVKVSDSSLDRDNEAILTDGWDFKNYMKNPIFIACHDACELISIIGKTINIEIRPDGLYHQFQYFVGLR
jgi:hypothetical protein